MKDKVFSNLFNSKIWGIYLQDLNKILNEFICRIQFEIYVDKTIVWNLKFKNIIKVKIFIFK